MSDRPTVDNYGLDGIHRDRTLRFPTSPQHVHTDGNCLGDQDAPTCVTRVTPNWATRDQDGVIVDVTQLQRSDSPPAVGRNAKLRRFVQPTRLSTQAN